MTTDLVTKKYLDKALKTQDNKWDKKLEIALKKYTKEIIDANVNFMESSVIPILYKILAKMDNIVEKYKKRIAVLEKTSLAA